MIEVAGLLEERFPKNVDFASVKANLKVEVLIHITI